MEVYSDFDYAFDCAGRLARRLKTILAYLPFLAERDPACGPITRCDGKKTDAVDAIAKAAENIRSEWDIAERTIAAVRERLVDARVHLATQDVALRIVIAGKPVRCAHDAILRLARRAASFVKAMDGEAYHESPVNVAELRKAIQAAAKLFTEDPDTVPHATIDALLAAAIEERDRAKRAAALIQPASVPAKGHAPTRQEGAEPDGPCGINQWRHNGIVTMDRLTGKPSQLAAYLYKRLGKKVSYAELNGPGLIWEGSSGDDTIRKAGESATKFFSKQNPPIPLLISTGDRAIWMESIERKENSAGLP